MITKTEIHTREDADGNITTDTKETTISKESEPDYIKLYTRTWCEFNQIPVPFRELFLLLAQKMSYCKTSDLKNSQIVYTGTPIKEEIMETLNWGDSMYQKGLKKLTEKGAIKRIARGVYQINPSYAGRGGWKYNPNLEQGGIKDLIATFNFTDKTVHTQILWADDGKNTDTDQIIAGQKGTDTIIKTSTATPIIKDEVPDFPQIAKVSGSAIEEASAIASEQPTAQIPQSEEKPKQYSKKNRNRRNRKPNYQQRQKTKQQQKVEA